MSKAIGSGGAYPENKAWCIAQMALLDFAQGAYVPAEQLLTEALKETPNNYHLLAAMGKVKAALKDFPAAVEYYKRAQAIVPQHEVVVALGDLYTIAGRTDDANRQYALVDVLRKLNKANGVIGDLQMAQFLADHDRDLDGGSAAGRSRVQDSSDCLRERIRWLGATTRTDAFPEARKYSSKALEPEHSGGAVLLPQGSDTGESRRHWRGPQDAVSGVEPESVLRAAGRGSGYEDGAGTWFGRGRREVKKRSAEQQAAWRSSLSVLKPGGIFHRPMRARPTKCSAARRTSAARLCCKLQPEPMGNRTSLGAIFPTSWPSWLVLCLAHRPERFYSHSPIRIQPAGTVHEAELALRLRDRVCTSR
jgi:tetratricopeptide (TPR) repeat protein